MPPGARYSLALSTQALEPFSEYAQFLAREVEQTTLQNSSQAVSKIENCRQPKKGGCPPGVPVGGGPCLPTRGCFCVLGGPCGQNPRCIRARQSLGMASLQGLRLGRKGFSGPDTDRGQINSSSRRGTDDDSRSWTTKAGETHSRTQGGKKRLRYLKVHPGSSERCLPPPVKSLGFRGKEHPRFVLCHVKTISQLKCGLH